jgi:hypothetical protein
MPSLAAITSFYSQTYNHIRLLTFITREQQALDLYIYIAEGGRRRENGESELHLPYVTWSLNKAG